MGNTNLSILRTEAERTISVHLAGRRSFLYNSANATLNGDHIPAAQPANAVVYFASWDYNPLSGNLNEQYVQLLNTNSYAVDVSGWQVTGGIGYKFRGGTVIPAGEPLYLSPNVNAFRARTNGPSAGQNLYVQGPFAGYLSTQGDSPLMIRNAAGSIVSSNSYAAYDAQPFLTGNLAVLRVGDGAESLSSHGDSVFVDEFSTNGSFLSSIAIPDNATNALIISGSASSEGALTRSADGRLLLLAGYHIALTNSGSSLASSKASSVPAPWARSTLPAPSRSSASLRTNTAKTTSAPAPAMAAAITGAAAPTAARSISATPRRPLCKRTSRTPASSRTSAATSISAPAPARLASGASAARPLARTAHPR